MMSPKFRKLMLAVHVTAAVGWLGAIAAYIALNVPVLASEDEQTVRAAYLMMEVVMRYALITLQPGTDHLRVRDPRAALPAVADMARVAADPQDVTDFGGDLFHPVGGLMVLLVPLVLNIYKPRGR